MAKTYIDQNKVDLCFKSKTMECLSEETTKQLNGKENKNEKMFKLKNRVKFRIIRNPILANGNLRIIAIHGCKAIATV